MHVCPQGCGIIRPYFGQIEKGPHPTPVILMQGLSRCQLKLSFTFRIIQNKTRIIPQKIVFFVTQSLCRLRPELKHEIDTGYHKEV